MWHLFFPCLVRAVTDSLPPNRLAVPRLFDPLIQPAAIPSCPRIDCSTSLLGIQHLHRAKGLPEEEANQEEISFYFGSR